MSRDQITEFLSASRRNPTLFHADSLPLQKIVAVERACAFDAYVSERES